MPLPPALATKLAKRGFITPKPRHEPKNLAAAKGFESCPNKCNIYHECTKYCITRWKVGILDPSIQCLKYREKVLRKYSLPTNWKEIYDRGCGRFYYWDTEKDLVSWLPPKHPRAKISRSAAFIREEMLRLHQLNDKRDHDDKRKRSGSEEREMKKDKNLRLKGYKKSNSKDFLDPMDPAAYSDVPKGTWSSGLENRAEAKTGADTTAAGPLYQMRPYPSPGAILAANAKSKHVK